LEDEDEKQIKKWTFKQVSDKFINFPIVKAFYLEGKDFKDMLNTFSILLMEKLNIKHRKDIPTPEEVKEALKQLKDVPKIMPFVALLLMPIPGVLTSYTLISFLLYKLSGGQINMLPDKFNIIVDDLKDKKVFSFLKKKK
jgi:hypothetical protein